MDHNNINPIAINENTHVLIDARYLINKVYFLNEYYIFPIIDCIDILMCINLFLHLNSSYNSYNEKLIMYSIVCTLLMSLTFFIIRLSYLIYALQFYNKVITLEDQTKYLSLTANKYYYIFSSILFVFELIPDVIIIYFFVPFRNSHLCNLYGTFGCTILRIFSVVHVITLSILAFLLFLGVLSLPFIFQNGIYHTISQFLAGNIFGLFFGTLAEYCVTVVERIDEPVR